MPNELFTIGHSTHPIGEFLHLLAKHSIDLIVDVRSQPYSQMNPQFNREILQKYLREKNIGYLFMGKELGARSDNPACYYEGRVVYDFIVQTKPFQEGIERVRQEAQSHRLALICAEKDPIMCHRTILVCRYLRDPGTVIKHILADGSIELNTQSEQRLMSIWKIEEDDFFEDRSKLVEKAYDKQAVKIAFRYEQVPNNTNDNF